MEKQDTSLGTRPVLFRGLMLLALADGLATALWGHRWITRLQHALPHWARPLVTIFLQVPEPVLRLGGAFQAVAATWLWLQGSTRPRAMVAGQPLRGLINNAVMAVLRLGLSLGPYSRRNAIIVETIGRHSGKRRRTPVGCLDERGQLIVVAEHGTRADWVRNALAQDGRLRVYHRGRWYNGRLRLLDADPESYLVRMEERHASYVRKFATTPRAVEITLEQPYE